LGISLRPRWYYMTARSCLRRQTGFKTCLR
jgi:hypothetical protein